MNESLVAEGRGFEADRPTYLHKITFSTFSVKLIKSVYYITNCIMQSICY